MNQWQTIDGIEHTKDIKISDEHYIHIYVKNKTIYMYIKQRLATGIVGDIVQIQKPTIPAFIQFISKILGLKPPTSVEEKAFSEFQILKQKIKEIEGSLGDTETEELKYAVDMATNDVSGNE
jgi:hypothetical protein